MEIWRHEGSGDMGDPWWPHGGSRVGAMGHLPPECWRHFTPCIGTALSCLSPLRLPIPPGTTPTRTLSFIHQG